MSDALDRRQWSGSPGRLEVWYTTLTDHATGTGAWIHQELVAPDDGEPYVHGWTAVFWPDDRPAFERWERAPVDALGDDGYRLRGKAGSLAWDLAWHDESPPLYTFSKTVWERRLLPAAQIVPHPTARFDGWVVAGDRRLEVAGATGGMARIYGHGSAERWGWLHADLGDGDVLELVTAVGRRPGLRRLPPAALVQLRVDGEDWPANPATAAVRFRTDLGLPRWSVHGTVGRRRLRVEVELDPDRSVEVGYVDPDGATATCTNSERARAVVEVERWEGSWRAERRWELDGTAHAEVGTRP